MSGQRRIRIGIDVGGTFTHAVAIDAGTVELVGRAKLPTTHDATEGVARGIVDALMELLKDDGIAPAEIAVIAHSTTQATNALLEGDVASVGIIGMGSGVGAALARRQTAIKPIRLAAGKGIPIAQQFINSEQVNDERTAAAIGALARQGAEVIVAAEAFSVDDPTNENLVCRVAEEHGLPATATHRVSQLHGLGIRTRTAVINACMIPRMLETANMTERAVREAGIAAPLMIMRSDGGVMDIAEMRRRPILTMLSGPAAGVAAALLYARISDGVFLEVGGTSTDISAIKNGRTQIRSAEIGGQKLFVSTLDVRTIGVAGGSMIYLRGNDITQVGPRSAHIAGLPYLSFTESVDGLTAGLYEKEDDRYLTIGSGEDALAVTPTCASNALGLVPDGDPAAGNREVIAKGFDKIADHLGLPDARSAAGRVMEQAAPRAIDVVNSLIDDYKLDRGVIQLIAGGGGGSAIVPYVAGAMGLPHTAVENADVISAIGVALALVRDTVERTIVSPTDDDIRRIREEAIERVLRMGAAADRIEANVEVDAKRNLLRAIAEGSLEIREQELRSGGLNEAERKKLVITSIGPALRQPELCLSTAGFEVWSAPRRVPRFWRFFTEDRLAVRVLDTAGAIRWASNHAAVRQSSAHRAGQDLETFAEMYTRYSDAGATIPRCFVLLGGRIVDLSGLVEMHQVLSVLQMEISRQPADAECALLLNVSAD